MRRKFGLTWRRRGTTAGLLVLSGAFIFFVAGAFADAGNPILGTINSVVVNETPTTITIHVQGQWNWQSHKSDCNLDRAGTGTGIIWNDKTETGWTVGTQQLGVQTQITGAWAGIGAGTDPNPIDRMTHPVDLGNKAVSPALPGLAGQTYSDPAASAAPGTTQVNTWKGGCGREPMTVLRSPVLVSAASKSGNTVTMMTSTPNNITEGDASVQIFSMFNAGYNSPAADIDLNFVTAYNVNTATNTFKFDVFNADGTPNTTPLLSCTTTTACKGKVNQEPWGSWGYQAGQNANSFTHTYRKKLVNGQSGLPERICVNFYDSHGTNQVPESAKSITLDGNGDNSIGTNDFDVTNGRNCITFKQPTLVTRASSATVGGNIHDNAILTGGDPGGYGGTISFTLYKDPTPGGITTDNCSAQVQTFGPFTVTGNSPAGDIPAATAPDPTTYTSGNYDTTSTGAGTYFWTASYTGDLSKNVLSASTSCGDANETSPVGKKTPTLITDAGSAVLLASGGNNLTDKATLGNANGPAATGNIKFFLFADDANTPGACGDLVSVTTPATNPVTQAAASVNGNGDYVSKSIKVTAQGLYHWVAIYLGDSNYNRQPNVDDTDLTAVRTLCGGTNEDKKVLNPSISVTKSPASQSVPKGTSVTFTVKVKNTSVISGGLTAADLTLSNAHTIDYLLSQGVNGSHLTQCEKDKNSTGTGGLASMPPAPGNADPGVAGSSVTYTCDFTPVNANETNFVGVCATSTVPGASDDVCDNDENDTTQTSQFSPSDLTTKQDFLPRDTATLTGLVGANPGGTLTFSLFKGTTCASTDQLDLDSNDPNTKNLTAAVTGNTSYTVIATQLLSAMIGSAQTNGTYSWKVSYSGNAATNNAAITGACGTENFTVDND